MVDPTTIAVDLAKSVFEVSVSEQPGRVSQRKRLTRSQFGQFLACQPPATVLMEACGSSHHFARVARSAGHQVRLLPVQHVCRDRLREKTDHADTRALLEANRNEKISPVPVKTLFQQSLAALHRIRSGWMATRMARLNTVRGLLRELGINIPLGARLVLPRLLRPSRIPKARFPKASIRSCWPPPMRSAPSRPTFARSIASSSRSPSTWPQPPRFARCPASAF